MFKTIIRQSEQLWPDEMYIYFPMVAGKLGARYKGKLKQKPSMRGKPEKPKPTRKSRPSCGETSSSWTKIAQVEFIFVSALAD